MELAIAAAGALAVICGISISIFIYYHKHSLIIWATYFAVISAVLVPFLYWQKLVWAQSSLPPVPLPVSQPSPTPDPSPIPTPSLTPSPSPATPSPSDTPLKLVGSEMSPKRPLPNTSPPYFADLYAPKWTDYTEDYFGDAIWRWEYRPEMPGQTPRNIGGYCPDCKCALRATNLLYPDPNGDGNRYLFDCPFNDHRFFIPAVSHDPYEGVKRLIQEKLKDRDYWEAVVMRQREARKGRRI